MSSNDNRMTAVHWVDAIEECLSRERAGNDVVVHAWDAPSFALFAVADLVPLKETWEKVVEAHRPVIAHMIIEELAGRGLAAHPFSPPLTNAWLWQRVCLSGVWARVNYQGYGREPESGPFYDLNLDVNLLLVREDLTAERRRLKAGRPSQGVNRPREKEAMSERALCPTVYKQHLREGDRPQLLNERLRLMADMPGRRSKVAALASSLFEDVQTLSLADLLRDGSRHESPRMKLRRLHDLVIYKARGQHCHASVYRSVEAHELLLAGGLETDNAVLHCEHTVPTGVVLSHLHAARLRGAHQTPRDLLQAIFTFGIVTAVTQRERKHELSQKREIEGRTSAWSKSHPCYELGTTLDDGFRPFLRYSGTPVRVVFALTGEKIELNDTVAEHRSRISGFPVYDASEYFL